MSLTGDPCSRGCPQGRSWKASPVFEVSSLGAEISPWRGNGYKAGEGINLEFTLRSLRKGGDGAGPAHLPNPITSSSVIQRIGPLSAPSKGAGPLEAESLPTLPLVLFDRPPCLVDSSGQKPVGWDLSGAAERGPGSRGPGPSLSRVQLFMFEIRTRGPRNDVFILFSIDKYSPFFSKFRSVKLLLLHVEFPPFLNRK